MILTNPSRKKFEFHWLEKKFLETSKVREAIFQNSLFEPKINPVQSKSVQKESFGRLLLWLCWSLKFFSQVTGTQNIFWKALLGSYLSNKVTSTPTRRVVCILESKTWSSGVFWVLRPKFNRQSGLKKCKIYHFWRWKKSFPTFKKFSTHQIPSLWVSKTLPGSSWIRWRKN